MFLLTVNDNIDYAMCIFANNYQCIVHNCIHNKRVVDVAQISNVYSVCRLIPFSFQPVLNWCDKECGMCYMWHEMFYLTTH